MNESLRVAFHRKSIRIMERWFWRKMSPAQKAIVTHNQDITDQKIPVRFFRQPGKTEPAPLLVYYHGGGFIMGDLDTHDPFCRDLAAHSGFTVMSVDYRLAPEHPFPAGPEDCFNALAWARQHADQINIQADQIFIGGDSAGGNLAAVTALRARDELPGVVRGQLLIYPVTDYYEPGTESYLEKPQRFGLSRSAMIWMWNLYLTGSPLLKANEKRHPMSAPLSVENLAGLPPALVITAQYDPLRDEGKRYAERMVQLGVKVHHSHYWDQPHGFVGTFGPTRANDKALAEICQWLAQHSASSRPTDSPSAAD